MKKHKRRFLVDRKYQFIQAGIIAIANIFTAFMVGVFFSWYYLIGMNNAFVTTRHGNVLPMVIFIILGVVFIGTLYFSFKRSRATAGMIEILHKLLDDACRGRFPEKKVMFRENDYKKFRELAGPLNKCFSIMKQKNK